jgi:hypothetical protein
MQLLTRSALPSSLFLLFVIRGGEGCGRAGDDSGRCFALREGQTFVLIDIAELYLITCFARWHTVRLGALDCRANPILYRLGP